MSEKPNKAYRQKNSINYWFLKTTFYDFLFSTKKYSELYKTRVAFTSLILAIISIWFIWMILQNDTNETFLTLLQSLLVGMMAGFMRLLGFVIGGLALVFYPLINQTITG